jgi:hypothetical protein
MEVKKNQRSKRNRAIAMLALCLFLFCSGLAVVDSSTRDLLGNGHLDPIFGIDGLDSGGLRLYLFGEEMDVNIEGIKVLIASITGWIGDIKGRAISGF